VFTVPDLLQLLEAGTGATAGNVLVGLASDAVTISSVSKTTTVRGNLVANTLSVTGALSASSVTVSGALTATAGITTAAAVTVTGSAGITGTLLLGADTTYTIGRRVQTTANHGRTTFLLGIHLNVCTGANKYRSK